MNAAGEWLVAHAEDVVWVSLILNIVYAFVFACAENWAKCLYFMGAAILTIGLLMMR